MIKWESFTKLSSKTLMMKSDENCMHVSLNPLSGWLGYMCPMLGNFECELWMVFEYGMKLKKYISLHFCESFSTELSFPNRITYLLALYAWVSLVNRNHSKMLRSYKCMHEYEEDALRMRIEIKLKTETFLRNSNKYWFQHSLVASPLDMWLCERE